MVNTRNQIQQPSLLRRIEQLESERDAALAERNRAQETVTELTQSNAEKDAMIQAFRFYEDEEDIVAPEELKDLVVAGTQTIDDGMLAENNELRREKARLERKNRKLARYRLLINQVMDNTVEALRESTARVRALEANGPFYECTICYERIPLDGPVHLIVEVGCGHVCCSNCNTRWNHSRCQRCNQAANQGRKRLYF